MASLFYTLTHGVRPPVGYKLRDALGYTFENLSNKLIINWRRQEEIRFHPGGSLAAVTRIFTAFGRSFPTDMDKSIFFHVRFQQKSA